MGLFLVSYNLVKEKSGYDYKPLIRALEELAAVRTQWSVWYVDAESHEA